MAPTNKAAWLTKTGSLLEISEAPMPMPAANEIVIQNAAIAINPVDTHMAKQGVFVQTWPAIIGCDVAGTVVEVSEAAQERFKVGDRVIGHTTNLVTGSPAHGAFALYTAVPANKAAHLPPSITFTSGVVVPFALEAAACVLYASEATEIMPQMIPGLMSPNLGLPYPSIDGSAQKNKGLVLVVYGGAASSGIMTTQLATASGISVVAVAGKGSVKICTSAGATSVIDRSGGEEVVKGVVAAVKDIIGGDGAAAGRFVGIFDAISTPETHAHDIAILAALADSDGKFAAPVHLACTNPPPSEGLPENVKAGMIFAVSDVATPIWETFVGPALEKGIIKCLPPPNVVGKGLEFVQEALERSEKGVNATKLVVEL